MRVVVTLGSDGTISRMVIYRWPRWPSTGRISSPGPGGPCRIGQLLVALSTIFDVDDRDVMVAEHDLAGPLLGLVTAVLAEGGAP
jgi:hypothetical protein